MEQHDLSVDDLLAHAIRARDSRVVKCNCNSTCSTKKCPCKALSSDCTRVCTCGTKTKCCRNNKPVPEDSDESDEDNESDDEIVVESGEAGPSRKRGRTDVDDDGGLSAHLQRLSLQDRLIKEFVDTLGRAEMKRVCIDLLRRNPGAYSDYVAMRSVGEVGDISFNELDAAYERFIQQREEDDDDGDDDDDDDDDYNNDSRAEASGSSSPEAPSESPDPDQNPPARPQRRTPSWCRCTRCREMPTDIEKKCCKPKRNQQCMAATGEFARLCLDNMVLEIAMRVHEDLVANNPARNNAAYRHQAYRCYIYWQHGRLGPGNRRVTPSCVVWAIRNMWPEPTAIYKGFVPGIGHLGD